jgi:CubicO group peptidase (beta-lactamase class C family)
MTYQFILQATKEGRIAKSRIDQAVLKILQAKRELRLGVQTTVDLKEAEATVNTKTHRQKAERMADDAITLVRDEKSSLPLYADEIDSMLVITITDGIHGYEYQERLFNEVSRRVPGIRQFLIDSNSGRDHIMRIVSQSEHADAIIIGMFVRWASYKGSITLPDTTISLIQQLFKIPKRMAVISFGSPYILNQLHDTPSFLSAYDTTPLAVGAAVRATFGEIPVRGRLPVSLSELYPAGLGLEKPVYPMELVNAVDNVRFSDAFHILEDAVSDSVIPGAQVAVVHKNRLIASKGIGHFTYDPSSPEVNTGTLYDLSSLTKVLATTPLAMRLFEQEKISLEIPVNSYLPEFRGVEKDSVTLRHLLTHSSGLPAWEPLWEYTENRTEAISHICKMPLMYQPGDSTVYSDLGIILLGEIIGIVTGQPLNRLVSDSLADPLNLKTLTLLPEETLNSQIAPAEIRGELNRGVIQGQVHDDNAYFLGGIAGHAGLFSNAEDIAIFSEMLLNKGIYRHYRLFQPSTVDQWTNRQDLPPGSERGLGWDTPSDHGSSAGDYFSEGSYGHLGFTGTSLWIDPVREVAIVLLTNRTYPTRYNEGIYQVRRKFHNSVMQEILESENHRTMDVQTSPPN